MQLSVQSILTLHSHILYPSKKYTPACVPALHSLGLGLVVCVCVSVSTSKPPSACKTAYTHHGEHPASRWHLRLRYHYH